MCPRHGTTPEGGAEANAEDMTEEAVEDRERRRRQSLRTATPPDEDEMRLVIASSGWHSITASCESKSGHEGQSGKRMSLKLGWVHGAC
eukprot:scaffold31682_cov31-Tisochrysis_lutea.AAC.3